MERAELVDRVIDGLVAQRPELASAVPDQGTDAAGRRRMMQALMNVRAPGPIPDEVLAAQDAVLAAEVVERGIVEVDELPGTTLDPRLAVWCGDITRLRADAIVNAANSRLLGCTAPLHACIDNAIHSAAGMQLREACAAIVARRARPEPTGTATVTPGFNLPAAHVIHTVGPIVAGELATEHEQALASCYRSCLAAAEQVGASSIAFCCISTGVFRFPKQRAAQIAVATTREVLDATPGITRVVFNVFSPADEAIYRELLGADRSPDS